MTLAEQALVGTRHAPAAVRTDTAVDDLLTHLPDLSLERRVLLTAGALAVYERAGHCVPDAPAPPEPAGEDERPPCSARVEAIVREMIACDHHVLLPEVLWLLARTGHRLAPTLLPIGLDFRDATLRDAVRPLLDVRGRWLARQRDDWRWADGMVEGITSSLDVLDRTWEVGAPEQRLAALTAMRSVNPAHARERLATTWAKEKVDDRLEFLHVLRDSLSPADEAWLESALNDRSRAVRAAIASLLVRLPGSACAARAVTRVSACIDWQAAAPSGIWNRVKAKVSGGEDATLHVTPPSEADPEWERDGVEVKVPKGMGPRAHWLAELLALVDPAHWSARFMTTPADLCKAAWQTEWAVAVLAGWSRGALLHGNGEWTAALWDTWMQTATEDRAAVSTKSELLDPLFAAMPADDATARVPVLLAPRLATFMDLTAAFLRLPRPWSEDVADAVVAVLGESARIGRITMFIPVLEAAGVALPAARLSDAERATAVNGAPAFQTSYDKAHTRFLARAALRRRLYEEIGQ